MITILNLINEGDICATPFLIMLLALVGGMIIGSDMHLRDYGKRAAGAAFLLYGLYGLFTFRPTTAIEFIGIVLRAALAAGLVLGVSWILLGAAKRVWVDAVVPWERLRTSRRRSDTERHSEIQRASEEVLNRIRHDEQHAEEQCRARVAARRRTARADVTRTFHLLCHQLEGRFSKDAFEDYVAKYMGDGVPADEVEQYGQQLVELLETLLASDEVAEPQTVREFAEHFEREKQALDDSDVDEQLKRMLRLDLEEQFEEKVRRYTRENLG